MDESTSESVQEVVSAPTKKHQKSTPTPPFLPFQDTYCPNCEEKFLTDLTGNSFCPIAHAQCSRNK